MLCNTPFTRYNHLTTGLTNSHCSFNWLSNRVFNRLNFCIHDTGLTTGCIVYTNIQPVWQQVVSCKRGLSVLLASQFTHCVQSKFQLLITMLLNTDFLTSSLNFLLNTCHVLSDHHHQYQECYTCHHYFMFQLSQFVLLFSNQIKPKYSPSYFIHLAPTLWSAAEHLQWTECLWPYMKLNVFGLWDCILNIA